MFSSGAFSYASPPERVLLSDTTNMVESSPFNSKFSVLKFNSANKNSSNAKSGAKSKKSKHSQNDKMKPKRLLDLKVDEKILGKGIFSAITQKDDRNIFAGVVQSTDNSLSNSILFDENFASSSGAYHSNNSNIPSSKFDN